MKCFLLFVVVCVCVVVRSCTCVATASMIPSASASASASVASSSSSASCPVAVDYGDARCGRSGCFPNFDFGFPGTFVGGTKSYIKQQGQVTAATINWASVPQGTVMLSRLMRNPLNQTQFKLVDQTTLTGQVLDPGRKTYRVNPPMFVDQGDFVGVTLMVAGDYMNYDYSIPQNGTYSMFSFFGQINKDAPYSGFTGTDEYEIKYSVRVTTPCSSSTGAGTGTGTGTGSSAPLCPVDSQYGIVQCMEYCKFSNVFPGTFISPDSQVTRSGQIQAAAINWYYAPTGPVMLSRFTRNPLNETQFKLVDQTNITVEHRSGIQNYDVDNPMFVEQGDFVGVTLLEPYNFLSYNVRFELNGTSLWYVKGNVNEEDGYVPFRTSQELELRFQFTVMEHAPCSSTAITPSGSGSGTGSGSGSGSGSGTGTGTGGTGTGTETGPVSSSSSSSSHAVIISSTAQQSSSSSSSSSSSVSFTFTLTMCIVGGVVAILLIVGIWIYIKKKRSSRHNVHSLNQSLLTTQP